MPKVPCPVCGKEVEKRALHMHMRTHEKEMRNQMPENQMGRAKVSNPSEMAGEGGEGVVERMRGVGKKGLDILNAWDEAYHKLLPDLWCVINKQRRRIYHTSSRIAYQFGWRMDCNL